MLKIRSSCSLGVYYVHWKPTFAVNIAIPDAALPFRTCCVGNTARGGRH